MEVNEKQTSRDEEYIFLDLDSVSSLIDFHADVPYILSGLDTLNPILVVGDSLKLIGEYQETIGTCLVFSENDREPVAYAETGPSERNLFKKTCIIADKGKNESKEVLPIASLHNILKFRLPKADEV